MSALLRAELIKLRTTRTFAALAGVALATSMLITGLEAALDDPSESTVLVDVFTSDTSGLFILVLAIVGISGEWRHRTITSSLLAAPARVRFLIAKTLAFAAAGLLLSLLVSLAISILGSAILDSRGMPVPAAGELVEQGARNALVAALFGAFGVGIGGLVRNQPVAIVGVLMMSFVFEPGLIALEPDVAKFGPFASLPLGIQDIPPELIGWDTEIFDTLPATLLMLAWIGIFFAVTAILLRTRDVE